MASTTITPSLDQAALMAFEDRFLTLAQQQNTKLASSKAIKYLPSQGKYSNIARIGRLELVEVNTRNPEKQFGDYDLDNRQLTKRRFTRTIQIDKKTDINELISDPTSNLVEQLVFAKNRVIDRVIASSAIGNVLVGAPNAATTAVSAATDGVITVSATSGISAATFQTITQNYINADLDYSAFVGSVACITGKENTQLMADVNFTNNFYITSSPESGDGILKKAAAYNIEMFAGSVNGGATVNNPVLVEGTTTRSCLVLAPEAIALSMELGDMSVEKSNTKVNSLDLTIDLWINAMRTEGCRTQIITTTI